MPNKVRVNFHVKQILLTFLKHMKTILPLQTENYFSLNSPKQCPPKESFNPLLHKSFCHQSLPLYKAYFDKAYFLILTVVN